MPQQGTLDSATDTEVRWFWSSRTLLLLKGLHASFHCILTMGKYLFPYLEKKVFAVKGLLAE